MGLFTYRQTKKTKEQVKALRADQARDAQAQRLQAAKLAQEAHETELFQRLPPEGKAEFRAAKDAFDVKASTWSGWKKGWGGSEVRIAYRELAKGKQEIFRKYDLVP